MFKGPHGPGIQSRIRRAGPLDSSFEQRNGRSDMRYNSMQPQPMPTFQQQQPQHHQPQHHQQPHNNRRRDNNPRLYSGGDHHQFTANHLEIVKMLREDWDKAERELLDYKRNKSNKVVEEHVCKEGPLQNFKPVDLSQVALSQYPLDNSIS